MQGGAFNLVACPDSSGPVHRELARHSTAALMTASPAPMHLPIPMALEPADAVPVRGRHKMQALRAQVQEHETEHNRLLDLIRKLKAELEALLAELEGLRRHGQPNKAYAPCPSVGSPSFSGPLSCCNLYACGAF